MSILYPENAIEIVQGTSHLLDIVVSVDSVPVNLTGASIYMTVRVRPEDDLPILFKSTAVGGGVTITDAASGAATITLTSADTKKQPGVYVYDIVAVIPSGTYAGTHLIVPETVLEIKRGVTRV